MPDLSKRDLSGGLPASRENIRTIEPDVPFWSENMLFAVADPTTGCSLWLHLGTVPNDWSLWHDMCYAVLPNREGVLSMWSHYRTPPELRPRGANLALTCIEPFRRWKVTFDGYGQFNTLAEMQEGRVRVGYTRRFFVDLDIEYTTPVWDMHAAAAAGHGSMEEQGWAKEHYEQLYKATGTVQFGTEQLPFNGYGWRDHSSGPRGGNTGTPWGGHVIAGTSYPESGRAWGLCSYWGPDGTISLEGGYVVGDDGEMIHTELTAVPRLRSLTVEPEDIEVGMKWSGGSLNTTVRTWNALYMAMANGLAVGTELSGTGLMYVLNHGTADWDGEPGQVYIERSDPLNAFPDPLKRA
jgi:hypothetical protein